MRNEIPTRSRRFEHVVGTIALIIVAAITSALILTAPVWSADDLALSAQTRSRAVGVDRRVPASDPSPTLAAQDSTPP